MKYYKLLVCKFYLLICSLTLFAQNEDSTRLNKSFKFSGDISITNNGISLIPSFALGKPALLAFFAAKKDDLAMSLNQDLAWRLNLGLHLIGYATNSCINRE